MEMDVVRVDANKILGGYTLYFLLGDERVITSMIKKDGKYYITRNHLSFPFLKEASEPARIAKAAAEESYKLIRQESDARPQRGTET